MAICKTCKQISGFPRSRPTSCKSDFTGLPATLIAPTMARDSTSSQKNVYIWSSTAVNEVTTCECGNITASPATIAPLPTWTYFQRWNTGIHWCDSRCDSQNLTKQKQKNAAGPHNLLRLDDLTARHPVQNWWCWYIWIYTRQTISIWISLAVYHKICIGQWTTNNVIHNSGLNTNGNILKLCNYICIYKFEMIWTRG